MFKGKKRKIDKNTTDTLIGEGTIFEGNIQTEAGIRIEGKLKGNVECQGDVTIGEKGVAYSNIYARDIVIAGAVHGNVIASGKVLITPKGQLIGNISSSALMINEGGVFQGTSKMEGTAASVPVVIPESA